MGQENDKQRCPEGFQWNFELDFCIEVDAPTDFLAPAGADEMEEEDEEEADCRCLANGEENEVLCEQSDYNARQCVAAGSSCHWGPSENETCVAQRKDEEYNLNPEAAAGPDAKTEAEVADLPDCGAGFDWNKQLQRCLPSVAIECEQGFTWSADAELCLEDEAQGEEPASYCPTGWKLSKSQRRCVRACPPGTIFGESVISFGGRQAKTVLCKLNDKESKLAKCRRTRSCALGKKPKMVRGACVCGKVKGFEPGKACGPQKKWSWRDWACVTKERCARSKPCPYGTRWVVNDCVCKREPWCPEEKKCGFGKVWHEGKCKCVRKDWCPRYKTCPGDRKGDRWDARRCQCIKRAIFKQECPRYMKWSQAREVCDYTKAGCRYAKCGPESSGVWRQGRCRCKTKKAFCNRQRCAIGWYGSWYKGACRCRKIPDFNEKVTTPGICGPGRRWSKKHYKCKAWKGCPRGLAWSNNRWKCVKPLVCPLGQTFSEERSGCAWINPKCPKKLWRCEWGTKWSFTLCNCQRLSWCPEKKDCGPCGQWSNKSCKCRKKANCEAPQGAAPTVLVRNCKQRDLVEDPCMAFFAYDKRDCKCKPISMTRRKCKKGFKKNLLGECTCDRRPVSCGSGYYWSPSSCGCKERAVN